MNHILKAQATHVHWREAKANVRKHLRTKQYILGHLTKFINDIEPAGFLNAADKKNLQKCQAKKEIGGFLGLPPHGPEFCYSLYV